MDRRSVAVAAALLLSACGEEAATRAPSFAEVQRETAARFGLPARFENALGMRFVLVPPGRFTAGSASSDPARRDDEVEHEVEFLGPYYVQEGEVEEATLAAWRATRTGGGGAGGVSHDEATAFAAWVSERDPRWTFRLPTEAEWEHAAREAEALSLHGTTGGAWEWCADWYGPYPDWLVQSPMGPTSGEERSRRGGGPRVEERRHARPQDAPADAGIRLMAPIAYAEADLGACTLTFRSVDADDNGHEVREHSGLEVRLISVSDRLSSRQMGRRLPWAVIAERRTPFTWHVPPGRYYAQAQTPGTDAWRGLEVKIYLDVDTTGPVQVINLPTPRKGAVLPEPE
jgi:hypothetical protein